MSEVCVLGVPDATAGEEIAAVITYLPGTTVSDNLEKSLREHCEMYLSKYKVPKIWRISTDSIPRNAMGKVNKKEVRELYFN